MAAPSVRIAQSSAEVVWSAVLLGVGGLLLGLLLPTAAQWVLSLPWVPLQGPLELIQRIDAVVPVWVLPVVGVLAGAVLALVGAGQEPVVVVSERELVITRGDQRTRVARSQVGEVRVEGKHLVVRDHGDVELAHQRVSGDVAVLQDALRRHDWPSAGSVA